MDISKSTASGITTFTLKGRLDTTTAPELSNVLIPEFANASQVIIDLKDVNYVSSAGLRVLLGGHKEAQKKSSEMKIKNVCAEVLEVFDMTGFSDILTII